MSDVSGLSATDGTYTDKVVIAWNQITNIDGYKLQYKNKTLFLLNAKSSMEKTNEADGKKERDSPQESTANRHDQHNERVDHCTWGPQEADRKLAKPEHGATQAAEEKTPHGLVAI